MQPIVDQWLKEPPVANVPPPPSPVPAPADLASSTPAPRNDWLFRFNRQVTRAKQGNCDLLFLGGITMALWDRVPDLFKQQYGADKPLNFANWGSRTENILLEIQNGGLDGLKPKLVVIQMQDNLLDATSAKNVGIGMEAIIQALKAKLPNTKILLEGAFPTDAKPGDPLRQKIPRYNGYLMKAADDRQVFFLDLSAVDPGPKPKAVTPETMKQWANAQRAIIAKLLAMP